jgi:hypothetical protein
MRVSMTGGILLLTALLAASLCPAADPPPTAAGGLVVHEWGTFSTFSGSDGKNLEFQPYDNDLPDFVHGYLQRNSKEGPAGGLISLETPVLYFYTERPLTASVKVEFPKGTLTEWFPHAGRTDKKLDWEGIKLLPQEKLDLPSEEKKSRYYAARETDAAPLRVAFRTDEGAKSEVEKFLFYRGVGNFDMPLSVRAHGDGKFTVTWNSKASLSDLILVRVQGGKLRFQPFRLERRERGGMQGEVKVPDKDATPKQLGEALAKLLAARGLYEKEARAMVKTWSSAWFEEEGTRVLYFLPDWLTDELLPLRVEPKPTSLVRVLVGRHDVLTPEREKHIDTLVKEVNRATPDPEDSQKAAWQELTKLGRYTGAARSAAEARLAKRQ